MATQVMIIVEFDEKGCKTSKQEMIQRIADLCSDDAVGRLILEEMPLDYTVRLVENPESRSEPSNWIDIAL
jgi:hypothetical protein